MKLLQGEKGMGRSAERRSTRSQEETHRQASPALGLDEMSLMLLAETDPARAVQFSTHSLPAPTALTFHLYPFPVFGLYTARADSEETWGGLAENALGGDDSVAPIPTLVDLSQFDMGQIWRGPPGLP